MDFITNTIIFSFVSCVMCISILGFTFSKDQLEMADEERSEELYQSFGLLQKFIFNLGSISGAYFIAVGSVVAVWTLIILSMKYL